MALPWVSSDPSSAVVTMKLDSLREGARPLTRACRRIGKHADRTGLDQSLASTGKVESIRAENLSMVQEIVVTDNAWIAPSRRVTSRHRSPPLK